MLTMHVNGECSRLEQRVSGKPYCTHEVNGIELLLYAKAYQGKDLLQLPLPLPFGQSLLQAPVVWKWSKKQTLTIKELDTLLSMLFEEESPPAKPEPLVLDLSDPCAPIETLEESDDDGSDVDEVEDDELSEEEEEEVSDDDEEVSAAED